MAECREGHYPYPEENVFLVAGIRTDAGPLDFGNTVPLAIVARKAELAIGFYEAMVPDRQTWEITGCVSLDQLRGLRQRMIKAMKDPSSIKALKSGLLASITGKRQPWAIAYSDASGTPLEPEVVMAASSSAVKTHAESSGKKPAGMFSLEVLDETIAMLDKVKQGKAEKIHYATDIAGGELDQELTEEVASWSDEQRAKADARMQRALDKRARGVI